MYEWTWALKFLCKNATDMHQAGRVGDISHSLELGARNACKWDVDLPGIIPGEIMGSMTEKVSVNVCVTTYAKMQHALGNFKNKICIATIGSVGNHVL